MKKSAFRKFALMIMFLLSFSFVLTGCSLFERNWVKYYDTVVVSIEYPNGDKIEINKKELITAYNNYGASLVQNSGYSLEDALNETINSLVNRKVMLKESENTITFTNKDKNTLWSDVVKALEENVESFAKEVREDWNIVLPETEDNTETENTVVYSPYSPKAEVVLENGVYVIKVTQEDEDENQPLQYSDMEDLDNKTLIVNNLYNYLMAKTVFTSENQNLTDVEKQERQIARVSQEAVNRYIKLLLENEEPLKLSKDSQSVFKREIERIYTNLLDSLKINKLTEMITYTSTTSKITSQDVLNKYRELLAGSIYKYTLAPSQFDTDVLSSFSSINYTTNQDYFFVSHILLKFSESQQSEYDSLESQMKAGTISALYYQQRVTELVNQIVAVERDSEGKVISSSQKKSETVLNEVTNALTAATTDEQKAQVFKNLLYKYNQDDGALNAEYLYVVGTENSQMVETFTEASRELYNNGNGTFGSISGLVPSQFGVHIVFYAGPVTNNSPIIVNSLDNINLTNSDLWTLSQTLLNPLNNKTLFDKVFESLTEESNSANQSMYINNLKKDLTITKFKSNYQDLLG